jgi:hypothetical protein
VPLHNKENTKQLWAETAVGRHNQMYLMLQIHKKQGVTIAIEQVESAVFLQDKLLKQNMRLSLVTRYMA